MVCFEADQWIPVPLPTVFAFFSDPDNLPRIMPTELRVRTERKLLVPPPAGSGAIYEALKRDKVAGVGSEFVFSFQPLPFFLLRMEWRVRIEEWEPGRYFRDIQLSGPMRRWSHRHEFRSERRNGHEGTTVSDRVEFEIGFSWAGRLLERYFVLPAMSKSFAHRQEEVERAVQSY